MVMQLEHATIASHQAYGNDYRLLALDAPRTAAQATPGQFVHLRIPGRNDLTLRRPFSIFRAGQARIELLYKVVGEGTRSLAACRPGEHVNLLGPLGRGFPVPSREVLPVLVGGGYGVAALHMLARQAPTKGVVFAGGKTASDILCAEEFRNEGWGFVAATEDGSLGTPGLVTTALENWIQAHAPAHGNCSLFACGPASMLKTLSIRAAQLGWPAWVSLDRHMACGVGACLACVQWVQRNGTPQRLQICREGPVFNAADILWDHQP